MLKVSYKCADYCQRFIVMCLSNIVKIGSSRNCYLFLQEKYIINVCGILNTPLSMLPSRHLPAQS